MVSMGIAQSTDAQPNKNYKVIVTPDSVSLEIGDTQQFHAYLEFQNGDQEEAEIAWSLTGRGTGDISSDGLFTALEAGMVHVVASHDRKSGKARVIVSGDSSSNQSGGKNRLSLVVEPFSAVVVPGDSVQFNAYLIDSSGIQIDTTFIWHLGDENLGHIDASGLFVAVSEGNSFVFAACGELEGKAQVRVNHGPRDRNRWSEIVVEPGAFLVKIGEQIQYTATLLDTQNNPVDTTFIWTLANEDCGTLSQEGLFTAETKGNSFVYATVGDLSGKAHVVVQDSTHQDNRKIGELFVEPQDTIITVGDVIHYKAIFVYDTGEHADTTVEWSICGRQIGEIDEEGIFTATDIGTGLIRAKINRYVSMARVMVSDPADTASTERDTVRVRFRHQNGESVSDTSGHEGQTVFTFEGLPWPLSMLNGGQVIFPPGSLDENISIDVTMPDFTQYENDSTVSYGDLILNGVAFDVYIGDSCVSPYYFNPPAHLVLPYDTTMLNELGMTADDLWMFFYTSEGELDSMGIFNVVVDVIHNKIYAEVSHFSTLIIAESGSQNTTGLNGSTISLLPSRYCLYPNYPNPFNPETVIRFDVSGDRMQHVRLSIFNILGQEIKVLVNQRTTPGTYRVYWDAMDELGRPLSSGIYIYRLKGEYITLSRRMILLR